MILLYAFFLYCLVLNAVTVLVYGYDKEQASRGRKERISEKILLLLAFLGGGIGAFAGMQVFRHKTRKWKFRILNPLAAAIWAFLLVSAFLLAVKKIDSERIPWSAPLAGEAEEASPKIPDAISAARDAALEMSGEALVDIEQKVMDNPAGTVISSEVIDWERLSDYFRAYEIEEGDDVYNRIYGKSYRENENISYTELLYLKMLHYNFDGEIQMGEMIVNRAIAADVMDVFCKLFERRYQICSMRLVDDYWTGDPLDSDEASIEADNTSCFNYRRATDAENLSNHAFGRAIDLNPRENPFILIKEDGSQEYYHENAAPYVQNRSSSVPHVITEEDLAYRIFTEHGFSWGGKWTNPLDYQHFELT